jgi:hypothetical protein
VAPRPRWRTPTGRPSYDRRRPRAEQTSANRAGGLRAPGRRRPP